MTAPDDFSAPGSTLREDSSLVLGILEKAVASFSLQKTLDEFWACVCRNARWIVPSQRMAVVLKDGDAGLLLASRIEQGNILKHPDRNYKLGDDFVGKAVNDSGIQWITEPQNHSSVNDGLRQWLLKDKPSGLLTVPIKIEAEPVGALMFVLEPFESSDQSFIKALVSGYSRYVGMTYKLLKTITELQSSKQHQQLLMAEIETMNIDLQHRNSEIEAQNIELENQNAELERFTYTVSHDLKTPLVSIKGFIGLLEKDLALKRDDRISEDLNHISAAADMMNNLLNDLLQLSRIGRVMGIPAHHKMSELVARAVDLLTGKINERNTIVEVSANMPEVFCDEGRLVDVYMNLIENSVKFMGEQKAPRVQAGVLLHNGEHRYYVKDNGIGIDEEYHEKVFGLFERLNPRVEGTGIGLSLTKRIIEAHGGRIWLESKGQGKGSTFWFTLPYS